MEILSIQTMLEAGKYCIRLDSGEYFQITVQEQSLNNQLIYLTVGQPDLETKFPDVAVRQLIYRLVQNFHQARTLKVQEV